MTTRVGRTLHVSAMPVPLVSTGSGYLQNAAVGSAFTAAQACGVDGGLIAQLCILDRGTASPALRVHFFSTAFSASQDASAFTIADADFVHYLGYVPVGTGDWVSAGTARSLAQVNASNIGVHAAQGSRTLWAQLQFVGTANSAMGGIPNPLWVNSVNLED